MKSKIRENIDKPWTQEIKEQLPKVKENANNFLKRINSLLEIKKVITSELSYYSNWETSYTEVIQLDNNKYQIYLILFNKNLEKTKTRPISLNNFEEINESYIHLNNSYREFILERYNAKEITKKDFENKYKGTNSNYSGINIEENWLRDILWEIINLYKRLNESVLTPDKIEDLKKNIQTCLKAIWNILDEEEIAKFINQIKEALTPDTKKTDTKFEKIVAQYA